MTVVLDASAASAIITRNPQVDNFRNLFETGEVVAAPSLYYAEMANLITKYVRKGFFNKDIAFSKLNRAISLIDIFYPLEQFTTDAFRKSLKLYHPSYDMYYLVLAQRLGATVFTFDKRLASTCLKNDVDCICGMSISVDDENQDWLVRTHAIDGSTIVVDD